MPRAVRGTSKGLNCQHRRDLAQPSPLEQLARATRDSRLQPSDENVPRFFFKRMISAQRAPEHLLQRVVRAVLQPFAPCTVGSDAQEDEDARGRSLLESIVGVGFHTEEPSDHVVL